MKCMIWNCREPGEWFLSYAQADHLRRFLFCGKCARRFLQDEYLASMLGQPFAVVRREIPCTYDYCPNAATYRVTCLFGNHLALFHLCDEDLSALDSPIDVQRLSEELEPPVE